MVYVYVCAKKKQKKIAQFFIRDIKNIRVRRFMRVYRVCVCAVSFGFVNQSNVLFLNRTSFYRFRTDIIVFETKQIPQMCRSRLKLRTVCARFVREIKKKWLKRETFVRLGPGNYVISVCAPPFRAACNDGIRKQSSRPTLVLKCDYHYYDVLIYYNYFENQHEHVLYTRQSRIHQKPFVVNNIIFKFTLYTIAI